MFHTSEFTLYEYYVGERGCEEGSINGPLHEFRRLCVFKGSESVHTAAWVCLV